MWDGTRRSSQNQIYTCMVRMIRKSWYITWENDQRKGSQNLKRKEIRKYIPKRRTLDSWLNYLGYADDDFCISYSWFLFETTHNRYFFSRIRLVFFPTFYKFIVWAGWAKAQSCLGFNPKLVLTTHIPKYILKKENTTPKYIYKKKKKKTSTLIKVIKKNKNLLREREREREYSQFFCEKNINWMIKMIINFFLIQNKKSTPA